MPDSNFLNRFFDPYKDNSPQEMFNLSRRSRMSRLREMLRIMRKHHALSGFTPAEFRATLEELGPSFIKVGQTLSMRSEVLPEAFCEELAKLQMECDPMPFETVLSTLDRIYEGRTSSIFTEIDPKPLGSASLAQVHKARLLSGEMVAIKVQRPGVRITMAQDIDLMRSLARRAERMIKGTSIVNLRGVVEELWKVFLEETDFKKEAENLAEFALRNKDVAFISCPRPYPELCTEEVLVMEYVDGVSIRDYDRLIAEGYDLEEIGDKILDNYATQILEHGFFHADPHPGNIVIREGKVVYLDLGIMGRLSAVERSMLGQIVFAVGRKNVGMLKDALLAFSVSKNSSKIDHPKLLASLDMVLDQYLVTDIADIDVGSFLTDILTLMRENEVEMPAGVQSVVRGLVTIEGTLLKFAGTFNIADIINSHIARTRWEEFDAKYEVRELATRLDRVVRGLERTAADTGDAVHALSRGQLKINMEMLGSSEPMHKLSRIVNRMICGMIIAAMLMSASILQAMTNGPMQAFSIIGYAIAGILSIWLLVDAYRHRSDG